MEVKHSLKSRSVKCSANDRKLSYMLDASERTEEEVMIVTVSLTMRIDPFQQLWFPFEEDKDE